MDDSAFERVTRNLPFLKSAEQDLIREFRDHAYISKIPAGRDVFAAGDQVGAIPLLLSGVVRVYQIGESGREVTLYRFRPGESCVLTANAILSDQTFPAIATVEETAEAIMIPADVFREWVSRFGTWRNFFIDLVSRRLASMMEVVNEVAFQRLDRRVAAFLLARMDDKRSVSITHQELAFELGSSREVISRILEDMVERGVIETSRGRIQILSEGELSELAQM